MLSHYGVTGVERSEALEGAVFRVFLAQQRSAPEVSMATSILQRWLVEPAPAADDEAAARELLDRLVSATQLRFPIVGDLARSVRFRWFDQPLVDADRASVLGSVGDELEQIDALPEGDERTARLDALAAIPERIVRFLGARLRHGVPAREPMLAVLIKRHYREYDLHDLREVTVDGRAVATADYRLDGRDSHLVSTAATIDEVTDGTELSRLLADLVADRPAGHQAVVDLYVHWADLPVDQEEASARARRPDSPGCRSPPRCAGSPWASCPTTSARSATSPSARSRTGRWTRTARCATCTRWSAAGSTCGGCATSSSPGSRRPRTCCCCTPSPPATRRTSASWRSPRCASSSSCATRPARSRRCRTSSGRWPTASRRSAGPAPPSAPAPGSTPTTSGCTSGRRSRPTSTS